jgi:monoamine oxidase
MGGASRVRGGNQRIAQALWQEIQRMASPGSVALKLGTECKSITCAEDGNQEVTVTTSTGECCRASTAVVVALPPRLALHSLSFRPSLPFSITRRLQALPTWMGSSCKFVARFDTPFWLEHGMPDEQQQQRGGAGARQMDDDAVFEWHDASSVFESTPAAAAAATSGNGAAIAGRVHCHALCGFARPGCTAADVSRQLQRAYASSSSSSSTRGFTLPPFRSFHVADWSADRFTSASVRDGAGGHPHAHAECRKSLWAADSTATKEEDGNASSSAHQATLPPPAPPLLLFASSELSEQDAGYMEGAVRRGVQVAQQIANSSRRWKDK